MTRDEAARERRRRDVEHDDLLALPVFTDPRDSPWFRVLITVVAVAAAGSLIFSFFGNLNAAGANRGIADNSKIAADNSTRTAQVADQLSLALVRLDALQRQSLDNQQRIEQLSACILELTAPLSRGTRPTVQGDPCRGLVTRVPPTTTTTGRPGRRTTTAGPGDGGGTKEAPPAPGPTTTADPGETTTTLTVPVP